MNRAGRNFLCLLLAMSMGISPSMVIAAQTASTDVIKSELSYIVPEAAVAGVVYPRRVLTSPEMEMLPLEVFSAGALKEVGVDPMDIESVTFMIVPPSPMPGFGVAIQFAKPYSLDDLKPNVTMSTTKSEIDGLPCLVGHSTMEPCFFMPDEKTLLIGTVMTLQGMLANHKDPKEGPACKLMNTIDEANDVAVVVDIESVRPMLMMALNSQPLPPPFASVKRLPELISAVKLQMKLTGAAQTASLELATPSESSAKEVEQVLGQLIDMGQAIMLAEMAKDMERNSADPVQQAVQKYMQRISKPMADALRPTREETVVKWSVKPGQQGQVATIGILVAMLLPAVQAAREAARRAQSMNNLKQIGLAMHNYADARKHFPQWASFDENGKPLLSWRVHILPFIEENDLYQQFKLDEPWDSPNNKKLIPLMPTLYRNPSSPAPMGKADYVVLTGPGSIFEGQNKTSFRQIKDGTSNTIMAVEVNPDRAVTWTKPDDLEYDEADLFDGLGKAHPGIFLALFADGSVQAISAGLDPEVLLKLFQMNDGEPITGDY